MRPAGSGRLYAVAIVAILVAAAGAFVRLDLRVPPTANAVAETGWR